MWFIPQYILILLIVILVDFSAGIIIESATPAKKKLFLILSIVSTCSILFVFKYYNFFFATFNVSGSVINHLDLILPIGLSFHTFQSLSYVIEVYRGNQRAERHLGIYSLYVLFYPQLVAGPIERPQNLLHQFREKMDFDYDRVVDGLLTMARGYLKKVVVADQLAGYVAAIYDNPLPHSGPQFLIATVFFSFQIYGDFSGYSDIAIGSAKVMGFTLMENFRRPYLSRSVGEFWRRWHISLSTWFKDYVYIPLGGSRVSPVHASANLMITFLISGLWHGANLTFVVWGGLNGLYLIFGNLIFRTWLPGFVSVFLTFVLICFSWIFFRAADMDIALHVIRQLPSGWIGWAGLTLEEVSLTGLIVSLLCLEIFEEKRSFRSIWRRQGTVVRWTGYNILVATILIAWFWVIDRPVNFIYFQF